MSKRKKKPYILNCNRCGKPFDGNSGFVKCPSCVIDVFAEYGQRLTKPAPDAWESARFISSFLHPSIIHISNLISTHQAQVRQTVGR